MNNIKLKKVQGLFHFVNNILFDGELPTPYIELYSANCAIFEHTGFNPGQIEGICIPDNGHYFIGLHNKLRGAKLFNTLVHEMIHIWMIENKKGYGHSGWFRVWCDKAIDTFYYMEN